jgi:hypothetical protein
MSTSPRFPFRRARPRPSYRDGAELPGIRYPVSPGPSLGLTEDCLAAIMDAAHVAGACIACTWSPGHLSQEPVITRLARVLGARLAW